MTITTHCKTPGCAGTVKYEERSIPAFTISPLSREDDEMVIYLECENGHTNKYVVENGVLK